MLARVEDESLLHPRGELGVGRQLVERLRHDGATDDGLDLGREFSEVDGRSVDLRDVRLRLRILLATQARFLLVCEDRGFGAFFGQVLHGAPERPLVVVSVCLAVRADQQIPNVLRLVAAEFVEILLRVLPRGPGGCHLVIGVSEILLEQLDLCLFLGSVFAQVVDGRDAAAHRRQGRIDERTVEDAHLGKRRRREFSARDLGSVIELQLDLTLREGRPLLYEREQ